MFLVLLSHGFAFLLFSLLNSRVIVLTLYSSSPRETFYKEFSSSTCCHLLMPSINKYLLSGFHTISGITNRIVVQYLQNTGSPGAYNLVGLADSKQMPESLIECLVAISVTGKIKPGEYKECDGGVSGCSGKASEVRE